MKSLTQGYVETLLADSRYLAAFPELSEAKRRFINAANNVSDGGCCAERGSRLASNDLATALHWTKKTIAGWDKDKAKKNAFLKMAGLRALQVSYNDSATGALTTVVLEPTA
jgi:hypothetical protein